MPRIKYRYNPKTLNYEKVKPGFKQYLKAVVVYALVICGVSALSIFLFLTVAQSPRELALKRELQFTKSHLELMKAELDTLELISEDLRSKDDDIYRNIFGADPYPPHLRQSGIGGADRYRNLSGYESSKAVIETKKRISSLQRQMVAQSKSLEELFELARNKKEMLSSIPAIQPIANEDMTRLASGYGYRIHPIYKIRKLHTGLDFSASTGTEIYATGDGEIMRVEKKFTGYGYNVMIQHGYGYQTLYAHMDSIFVNPGQLVKRGEVIGLVGNTGTSVAPHLHYEVIKDGQKVDPASYFFNDLTPEQYEEMLKKARLFNQSFD